MRKMTPKTLGALALKLHGLYQQAGLPVYELTAEQLDAHVSAWVADQEKARVRQKMLRYIAFVLSDDENADAQLAADRVQTRIATLEGKLLHAYSHDCTRGGDGDHGEERAWESLTDEQRLWWIAQATLPREEG